jgi:formylglycine-generating enzyme required for sulfatase activity
LGWGPKPEDDSAADMGIAGLVNLGGNVREWTLDSALDLSDPCWTSAPLTNPNCDTNAPLASVRGGTWSNAKIAVASGARLGLSRTRDPSKTSSVGIRCVRDGR